MQLDLFVPYLTATSTVHKLLSTKMQIYYCWTIPRSHKPAAQHSPSLKRKNWRSLIFGSSHTATSPQHSTIWVLKGKVEGLSYLDHTTRPQAHSTIRSFFKKMWFYYFLTIPHDHRPATHAVHWFLEGKNWRYLIFGPIPHGHKPAAQHSLSLKRKNLRSLIFWPYHTATSLQHRTLWVLKEKIEGLSYLDHTTRPQAHSTMRTLL
jgi:hypothetical protein